MANIKDITAGMTYVKIMVDNLALQKGLQKSESLVKRFGDVCASVGSKMAASGVMMASPFVNAVRVFSQFDDQMRMTKAVTAATGDEFALLSKRARQIGRDTAFSASQAAAGMTALGRMGFSAQEIDRSAPSVVDLALATGTDLAQAADIAANSMRIFKLQASDMTKVADVLTATANGSAQTLDDLFQALKMAGPQAAVAKESLEDVSAAIGVMANVGIKGSMAGTALRRAYVNMASSKTQEYLDQYNIKTVDATGNLRKMKDIIVDVGRAMQSMGSAEKMAFAEEVFDMRGSFVGLTLGGDVEGMQSFIRKLEQSGGVAKKTREEVEKGIGGAFRNLASAIEDVNHALASTISEPLIALLKKFGEAAKAVSQWISENAALVRSLAIGSAAVLALGAALTVLGIGTGALSSLTGNLRAVYAKIVSPLTEYRNAAEAATQDNIKLASSNKAVAGTAYARVQADGAALAAAHAQQQVAAAQLALANARTPAELAAARATLQGATANLEQARAAERAAQANLQAAQTAAARKKAWKELSAAQKHQAQSAIAAAAAKTAAEKRLLVTQAEQTLAQRIAAREVATATGIDVAAAKVKEQQARENYNVARTNYDLAKSEAAKAAAMQAALSPQAAQIAGTQKMLAMLGLQATAMNTAAVSILTMGNVQAASAAKTALASAALALHSSVGKANITVTRVLAATSTALGAAFSRQSVAAALAATTNTALSVSMTAMGLAAKAAAAATLGLTAVLNALSKHPVILALGAIALLYRAITKEAKNAAKATAESLTAAPDRIQDVNEERKNFRSIAASRDNQDLARLQELAAISQQAKLSAKDTVEAEQLLHRLGNRGFSNLPKLDAVAGALESVSDAAKESYELTKRQIARKDISDEYQDKLKELTERRKAYQELLKKGSKWGLLAEKQVYHDQAEEERARMQQLSQDLTELGKAAAAADAELAAFKAQGKETALNISVTANADAQKRLAEISQKIANDKLSDIEREINGIRELRDEYIALLKTRLAFERNKPKPNQAAIKELESMLAEAGAMFEGMESAAYEQHYKGIYTDLDELSGKREQERARNEKDARERAALEKLRQESPEKYKDTLGSMLSQAYADLARVEKDYKSIFAQVTSASSDGGQSITEAEKKRIEAQKELYDLAQSRIDVIKEKMLDLDLNMEDLSVKNSSATLAGFITADVLALVGGDNSPEEETARNTRSMAETLAVMKDMFRQRRPAAFA